VYSGTLNPSTFPVGNWAVIPFSTTTFAYNGTDNLEVIVEANFGGGGSGESSTSLVVRRSAPGGTNPFQGWNADTSPPGGTGSRSANRPNAIFNLTCFAPTAVGVSPGITTASVSFTAPTLGTPTGYQYQYRDLPSGTMTGWLPASNPFTITGLTANTSYEVSVRTNCGGGDFSAGTSVTTFTTLCSPVGAPISETFETTTSSNLPSCWLKIVVGTGSVGSTATSPIVGTRQAVLTTSGTASASNRNVLILPPLNDLGGLPRQLRFKAKSSSGTRYLQVGTVNGVGPSAVFTPIQAQPLPLTTTAQDFTIDYTAYAGSDQFVAFKPQDETSGTSFSIYIDNVNWEVPPACPNPSGLLVTAGSVSAGSAGITFTPNAANTSVTVLYGDNTYDPNVSTTAGFLGQVTGVTGSNYTLTGLSANTPYRVYVQGDCGGPTSIYTGVAAFTTLPAPLAVNVTGPTPATYTSIIGQPGTTWLINPTSGNQDDVLSAAQPIGFSFDFLGTTGLTQFKASSNGFITFNTATTATGAANDFTSTTYTQLVAPFWEDLYFLQTRAASGSGVYIQVSGTAPNRVLTVEWAKAASYDYTLFTAFQDANSNFQLKLYEGSNDIKFEYGKNTLFLGNQAAIPYSYSVGLKGTSGTQLVSQQVENTRFFANVAKNDLSIQPLCDVEYSFTQGVAYATYVAPAPSTTPGDQCGSAIGLPINNVTTAATFYCQTYTTAGATASTSGGAACTGGNADDDVWFTFQTSAAPSTNVNIRVGGSNNFNPVLQVYQGSSCGSLTLVGCFDATGAGLAESAVITAAPANTRYYARVYNKGVGTGGNGTFVFDVYGVPDPPINDNCSGASVLTFNTASCAPVNGTSAFATASTGVPAACSGTADDDVWYRFTTNGTYTNAQVNVVGASGFNGVVQVFSGTCGTLTSIACVDNTGDGGSESVLLSGLSTSTTYYVRVFHSAAGSGTGGTVPFTICVQGLQSPANDEPTAAGAATAFSLTQGTTCTPTAGTTVLGTATTGIPTAVGTPDDDVFYSFVAVAPTATITVVGGTTFDGVVQGLAGTPGSFTSLGHVDNSGNAGTETLVLTGLTSGTRYYVRVYDYSSGDGDSFTICIQYIPPPGNDDPSGAGAATPYSLSVTTTCNPTSGTNANATATTGVPAAPSGTADDDVWYSFVATAANQVVTVAGDADIDAVIAAYSYNGTAYTQVAYADDTFDGETEEMTLSGLTVGTRYYVRVYDFYSASIPATFTICVTAGPKVLQTITATQPSTAVAPQGAIRQAVLRINIPVGGAIGSLILNSVKVRGANTSNADIALNGVRLFRSNSATFDGSAVALGGVTNFNGTNDATFSGLNYDLSPGTTYLYVTYDVKSTATIGNTLDAQILANQININGTTYNATALNPTGVRLVGAAAPSNDEACTPITVTVRQGTTALPTYTTYSNATASSSSPNTTTNSCFLTNFIQDVWFKVRVPATGELNIDVRDGATGSAEDMVFAVYTGNCSGLLTAVGCSDDQGIGNKPAARVTGLTAGTDVLLRVGMFSTTWLPGNFQLAISDRPVWTGAVSNSTSTQGNYLPALDDPELAFAAFPLTILPGTPFAPSAANSISLRGLTISSGAIYTQTAGTLTLGAGGITGNGSFTQDAAAIVRLAGATGTPAPINVYPNLTLANLTVGPNGATMANAVNVTRVLTLEGNANLTTNGRKLTLISNASGTGMIVQGTGSSITGNVTAQRYINPSISTDPVVYRHMSAPVSTNFNDMTTYGPPTYVAITNPAWNSDSTSQPFPTVFSYNESQIGTNGRFNFAGGYRSPNSQFASMLPMVGYSVPMADGVTPDFTGPVNNGPYSRTGLTRGTNPFQGWHLIGNPYPAPLDWSLVNPGSQLSGLDGSISILRATGANSANYVSYTNGVGAGKIVPMAQAFFVRVSTVGGSGSVSLDNDDRVTTYQDPQHYRQSNTASDLRPQVKLSLVQSGQATLMGDETYVYFQSGATTAREDFFDAYKIRSTGVTPSVFSYADGEEVAINGLPSLTTAETVVPLGVIVNVSGSYKLNAADMLNIPTGTVVVLRDAVTGTEQDLSLNPTYSFTMDRNFRGQRFSLVFNPAGRVSGLSTLAAGQLSVFPNPVANNAELQVRMTALNANVKVVTARLVDAMGRVVATEALTVTGGNVDGAVNTGSLSKGVYTLQLTAGQQTATRRVVIQ
jgi:Secretion system C-terminal sorting domain